MIYAIWADGTEFIKFGFTADIDINRRLRAMQTGCPHELKLLAFCHGDKKTEFWLHWRLIKAKAFHRGEWFKTSDEASLILQEMKQDALKPEPVNTSAHSLAKRHKRLGAALELSKRKSGQWGELQAKEEKEKPAQSLPRMRARGQKRRAERESWWATKTVQAQHYDGVAAQQSPITADDAVDRKAISL